MSHRRITWLIVGGLVALGIAMPLIVGVTFGTGRIFHAIPFPLIASLCVTGAFFVYLFRNRVGRRPPAVDELRLTVEELYDRTHEHAFLFELPLPSTTVLSRGQTIQNGPFSLEACSLVLLRWFRLGWITLVVDSVPAGGRSRLSREEALALLREPDRWRQGTRDGQVGLAASKEGSEHPWHEWIARGYNG